MNRDRLIGYGLALAAGFQLVALVGAVTSPRPLLTANSIVSTSLAFTFAIVGVSFLSDEGATIDGSLGWRLMVAWTALTVVTSGSAAFFALA